MNIKTLCEYMKNPIGLDKKEILFSWSYDGFIKQKSAQLVVLDKENEIYNSGVIENEDLRKLIVKIEELKSGATYNYYIKAELENGETLKSEEAKFTMGLFEEWKAMWIGGAKLDANTYMYRKDFVLSKPLKRAAAFLASPCYNVLSVNGKKADDSVLNNVCADYEK